MSSLLSMKQIKLDPFTLFFCAHTLLWAWTVALRTTLRTSYVWLHFHDGNCSWLQWLIGFVVFMLQRPSVTTRAKVLPWHKVGGRVLLFMALCAAETGLMEKSGFLGRKPHERETNLINFTGLAILLFGVFVNLSVGFS